MTLSNQSSLDLSTFLPSSGFLPSWPEEDETLWGRPAVYRGRPLLLTPRLCFLAGLALALHQLAQALLQSGQTSYQQTQALGERVPVSYQPEPDLPLPRILDVGCDHGKLAIFLAAHPDLGEILGTDLRAQPLARATANAVQYLGVCPRLRFHQGDGLQGLNLKPWDIIIIAGLGGLEIKKIMEEVHSRPSHPPLLWVLQANTARSVLRSLAFDQALPIFREYVKDFSHFFYHYLLLLDPGTSPQQAKALFNLAPDFNPSTPRPGDLLLGPHFEDLLASMQKADPRLAGRFFRFHQGILSDQLRGDPLNPDLLAAKKRLAKLAPSQKGAENINPDTDG